MTFAYTALEPSGKKRTGFIDAANKEAALASISAQGQSVLDIREEVSRGAAQAERQANRKISRSELSLFSRRLADLSAAGLPLDRVLQVIAEQSESATLARIAEECLTDVRAGSQISDALAKHPKIFAPVYTQTLKAGEASGQFPQVASRLAEFQEKEVARRSQITAALIYPAVLASVAVLVVLFMLLFVVPRLSGIFKDLGNDLPVTTQILLSSTDFLTKNIVIIAIGFVVAILAYRGWIATPQGRLTRDRMFLTVPVIGPVARKATVSRFARVLSTLVFGGVPILEALRLSGLAAGNRFFETSSIQVADDVRDGRPLAEAMRDAGAFPPVLTHMVAIGEETGDLPKMLNRVSDSLDFEVDNGVRRLVALVEPLVVLLMAVFVGFVVLSVVLPIFAAQNTIK